jgi:hypothetical protein
MRITRKARETMTSVSDASKEVAGASKKVAETSEFAAIALIGVCAVSILALAIGLTALMGNRRV